jgi:integrase
MGRYEGRDVTRVQRAAWWQRQIGQVKLQDVTDDLVHATLEALAESKSRYYAGKDADGRPIFKARATKVAPATVNRHAAALAAIITWAIKRRVAPAGFVHPCRAVERRTENNERTRFLSDDERRRLLSACKESTWPRLYALVLMALTTGARKGELMGLRWADIGFERAEARVAMTKNGEPRVLPLVPAVLIELQRFKAGPRCRVFASPRDAEKAFAFDGPFTRALQAAKVRDFTFHCCRHSCASMLAANGATLLEIGDLLGHKQLQVTKRYAHLATSHKAALVNRVLGAVQ